MEDNLEYLSVQGKIILMRIFWVGYVDVTLIEMA
jgi:hypothetical protein